MPSTRVVDVLAEVFRTYGFDTTTDAHLDGQSGTEHLVGLLAEKGGLDAVLTVHQDTQPIGMDLVDAHDRMVRDIGARYGVLATTGGFTESAYAHAARTRTILWDHHDLEAVIGKAVLHEVIGDPETDLPIAEVLAHGRHPDPSEPNPEPAAQAQRENISVADSFDSYAPETASPATTAPLFGFDPLALQADDTPTPSTNGHTARPTSGPNRTPIIDAEADDEPTHRTPIIDVSEPEPTASDTPPARTRTPIIDAEADDQPPHRTPIIDASEPEPAAANAPPARTRTPIIDAEARDPTPIPTPAPVARARDLVEGRGWVLETRDRHDAPAAAVDATHDPDPVPVTPRPRRSIANIAALGGIGRVPHSSGPDPRVFNPNEGALLAPAVSKEQAASAVRDKIYTIDHTSLRYHPKRVYRWKVEAFVEGQVTTTTLTGIRVVDLATRHVEAPDKWTTSRSLREGTFDVPVDHKPVRIEEAKARALALDSVLDATAREITVEDHDTSLDIMVTEKRRVRTHRDDVHIDDEGLQWCPVWCFSGVNGEVEVDALTGLVAQERLEARTSNTILL